VYGAEGNVLAVYGFYFFEVRVPTQEELTSLENLRHLASVAIGKARVAQALRESEQHYRHTVEYNPQIPWTADATGRILSVSSRWTEATGLSVESALGGGWIKALHPDDVRQTLTYWAEKLSSGDTSDCKYRIRLRDGSFRWVRSRATPRRDSQGMIIRWYGAAEDIHELELATERLRRQVYFDDVARLLNRRGLEEALRERLENAALRNRPVGLIIVDINGFRHINDRYGHYTGDAALRLFGSHLGRCQGDVVARIAGDEFAIVIDHVIDNHPLLKRASEIATEMNRRLTRSAKLRGCSTSIGCAVSEPNERAEDLIRRANLALYAAKRDAHDAVKLYTPAIRRVEDERIGQTELAKQALRQGWVVPYYQPIVSLTTGEVVGAEALLRIARPTGNILSPAAIWAAFETFKVSRLLDGRMLSLVLSDFSRWKLSADERMTVSINLSTEMLLQDGLSRSILRKMERRGVLPQQVTIEITERVLIDNLAPNTHRALSELQRHGVRVSLDDFGTGFASLTHLQKLPVNEIKIDRSFVKALQVNGPNAAIVKSMISLGLNIGVDVVAEGVETAQQAKLLHDWGCPFAQGFHFFKPMSANAFGKLLKHASERAVEGSRKSTQPQAPDRHHSV
jgi:diguanylate cyclase (GGDEF)-like protein/PAS domain S-box-containing protein